jgi:epoxyqueuosine reductase
MDTYKADRKVPADPPFAQPAPGNQLDTPRVLTRDLVRTLALEVGFTEAGLAALPHENEIRDAARFEDWIRAGNAGEMHYLTRTSEDGELLRARPRNPFPWARSVIVCAASYNAAAPRSTDPALPNAAWIARYAWSSRTDATGQRRPSDYHKVLLKRLKQLDAQLRDRLGAFESRAFVDTGPIVERALATAAGLGWSAKNTCLIHPKLGSYLFLGALLTSIDVEPTFAPLRVRDHCGTCTRCIQACPTDALATPYKMDATRCIAYLTIEHRGPLDEDLMPGIGRQVFGCDICQDVCPWNRKAPISTDPELEPRPELINPALDALAALDEPGFERTFNGSPIRRTGFLGLRRNLAVAMGNSGLLCFQSQWQQWAQAPGETPAHEALRSAAQWALRRLVG